METAFRSGEALIQDNSGESLGASREELEEGVRRVERALRHGFPDKKKAYQALAHAYNALGSRVSAPQGEALGFLRKEGEALKKLAQLEPGEPEWLMAYVTTIPEHSAQIGELEHLVRQHPGYIPARKLLAVRLCASGRSTEGMQHVLAAAERLTGDAVANEGPELVSIAWHCNRQPGANRVQEILDAKQRPPR